MGIVNRVRRAWNVFSSRDPTDDYRHDDWRYAYGTGQHRRVSTKGSEKSIINAIYNRIAIDVSTFELKHVKTDSEGRYIEDMGSSLNKILTLEANIDQTSRSFIQDVVVSMLDEGVVALVPTDTTVSPYKSNSYDVLTMRTGKIIDWRPYTVNVELYNENTGLRQTIDLKKEHVGIVENPLYSIINEPNSTLQRLMRKLSLLDVVDEQSSSGKLDLIIQLPYVVKTQARREQAEIRRKDIEAQLTGSKYGVAYTDGTEKITQLNRPVENNLMKQVEYLTNMVYSQIGITEEIMNGTANDKAMLNYYTRIIEPIVSAIVDEIKRKFLTKTARTQNQDIMFFRDPFKMTPVSEISEMADKFTRNEILSSNEVRQIIGRKPSKDPKADQLVNKNLKQESGSTETLSIEEKLEDDQNG